MNKIKAELEKQGRTKIWLAKELGVHRSAVYKYCSNTMQPDIVKFKQISLLLGVKMEDLII